MKRIRPVVLKDATKLTNSEMKKIRGGVTAEGRPSKCSMQCDTGAIELEIEADCEKLGYGDGAYCETSATVGITCYSMTGQELGVVKTCEYE